MTDTWFHLDGTDGITIVGNVPNASTPAPGTGGSAVSSLRPSRARRSRATASVRPRRRSVPSAAPTASTGR